MPSFGMSAFLRIAHMNDRPQRTELRKRSKPSKNGYDFHSSLRRLGTRLLIEGVPLETVTGEAESIKKPAERRSAKLGLANLDDWRRTHAGAIVPAFEPATFESPAGVFKVTFSPNFALSEGGQRIAAHLWNTAKPRLDSPLTRAVLSLFSDPYRNVSNPPDDIAVLCLRTMRLIRLGNAAEVTERGRLLVARFEDILRRVAEEAEERPSSPADRPDSPAPPR